MPGCAQGLDTASKNIRAASWKTGLYSACTSSLQARAIRAEFEANKTVVGPHSHFLIVIFLVFCVIWYHAAALAAGTALNSIRWRCLLHCRLAGSRRSSS
jgi:hypothetical protein